MKPAVVLVVAFVALVAARPDDDFTLYKNINVDEIVANKHLLKPLVECFLGSGTCTADGSEIKEKIARTVRESCSRCSGKQKTLIAKIMHAIKAEFPEDWEKLDKIYNPEGKYDTKVNEFLQNYGH